MTGGVTDPEARALGAAEARALGAALRRAGLTERAVLACFGVRAIAHVPRAIAAGRRFDPRPPPAAAIPWLCAGGGDVAADLVARALGDAAPLLERAGLATRDGDVVRARRRVLPAGPEALAVCDAPGRADADDPVFHPDDSSHHLVGALPPRHGAARIDRWLDLATGAGWAPLAAAGLAATVVAADLSPRAVEAARLGAALSGVALDVHRADLADGLDEGAPYDLITANLPIPGATALIARFWREAAARVAPGGEVLLHAALADDPLAPVAELPGEIVVARYTPPDLAPFGVTAWRPGRPPARRVRDVALTRDAPHLRRTDLS